MKINSINTTLITPKRQQYKKVGLIPNASISITFGKLTEKKRIEIKRKLSEATDKNGKKFFTKKNLKTLMEKIEKTNIQDIDFDMLQQKLFSQIDNSYEIHFFELRPFGGYQFMAQKYTKNEFTDYVNIKTIYVDNNGTIKIGTTEKFEDNQMRSWDTNPSKTSIIYPDETITIEEDEENKLSNILIECDENNKPEKIISIKQSPLLAGGFDEKEYTLMDYPENWDMIDLIKSGKIASKIDESYCRDGELLGEVEQKQNGVTVYNQEFTHKGIKTKKHYSQKVNKKGEIQSYEYSYKIIDKDGSSLLDTERTWQKTLNGSITTINGKKYKAMFRSGFGHTETLIKNPDNSIVYFFPEITGDKENNNDKFIKFLKTLPADMLIDISNVLNVKLIDNPLEAFIRTSTSDIETSSDKETFAHELGHNKCKKLEITKNEELKEIYRLEEKAFYEENPNLTLALTDYFLSSSNAHPSGLAEIIAETNMLMTSYGHKIDSNEMKYRALYLQKYFPKTIAKIADLLGYNKEEEKETSLEDKIKLQKTRISNSIKNFFTT